MCQSLKQILGCQAACGTRLMTHRRTLSILPAIKIISSVVLGSGRKSFNNYSVLSLERYLQPVTTELTSAAAKQRGPVSKVGIRLFSEDKPAKVKSVCQLIPLG